MRTTVRYRAYLQKNVHFASCGRIEFMLLLAPRPSFDLAVGELHRSTVTTGGPSLDPESARPPACLTADALGFFDKRLQKALAKRAANRRGLPGHGWNAAAFSREVSLITLFAEEPTGERVGIFETIN